MPAASSPTLTFGAWANTRDPGALILTAIAFVVIALLIWFLSWRVAGASANKDARSSNLLVALLGGLCGWILGIVFTPYSESEALQFTAISTAVSAFLSGYVVSKVDRFLERTLFSANEGTNDSWARVGLFAMSLLLAAVTVSTSRLYASSNENTPGKTGLSLSATASAPKAGASEGSR